MQISATARMDTQAQRVNTTCMTPSFSLEVISYTPLVICHVGAGHVRPAAFHNRAVTGTLRAGMPRPYGAALYFTARRPRWSARRCRCPDLVNGQILGGVGRVDDDGDAVQCQNGSLGTGLGLGVLQLTAGHADGVGAVQRAGNTGGGVAGEQLKLGVGVDGLVGP